MQKNSRTYRITSEDWFHDIPFMIKPWDRIAFTGDLGAGKTTYIRHLLRSYFRDDTLIIRSPSYTYYNTYEPHSPEHSAVYHFDLYRLEDPEEFFLIGGNDILESSSSIILIEWPEILEDLFMPTHHIHISVGENDTYRDIIITEYTSDVASSK